MADSVHSFVTTIKRSKTVLFVIHEYLPLSLALWLPAMVKLLLAQGKDITVLIKQESLGWLQQVDQYYPIDMVLALDELKQVISIPVSSERIGQLSYEVEDKNLNITIIPDGVPASLDEMKTFLYGKKYDVVVGVGVSARHPLIATLNNAKSSLSSATYYFIGSVSPSSSLSQALSNNPQVEVIDDPTVEILARIAKDIKESTSGAQINELLTLFLHAHVRMIGTQLTSNTYTFLAELVANGVDSDKMSSIFTYDAAQLNDRVQLLLSSMTVSSNGHFALFGIRKAALQQYAITAQDLIFATYYLPQYTDIDQCVVVVEENEYLHQVVAFGNGKSVKQIAIKYGFPFSREFTGGIVSEVNFDKLCQDVTRVMAEEELLPKVVNNQSLESPVVSTPVTVDEIPISPSFEVPAENGDVVAQSSDFVEVTDEPVVQQTVAVSPDEYQAPPPATIPAQSQSLPAKQTLDFAAIAKKMKESIS